MKTLKQQLLEQEFLTLKTILETVKEWLTQKRQKLRVDPTNYIFKTDILTIQAFIDVLLEELNHE